MTKERSETSLRGSEVLAFTPSYGERRFLAETVRQMRAYAGCWFDWAVYLGAPSPEAEEDARRLVEHPDRLGIQYLQVWPENRGQHHAFKEALALAEAKEYRWLLRLDDDVLPKTKSWLKKMLAQVEELRELAGDQHDRIVAAPRVLGLKNPLQPVGLIEKGQDFPAEVMAILGGVCRLHSVEMLSRFEPDLYAPTGRGDPEGISFYIEREGVLAMQVRLPSIRVRHNTAVLEAVDSEKQAYMRRMSYYWPYLGPEV